MIPNLDLVEITPLFLFFGIFSKICPSLLQGEGKITMVYDRAVVAPKYSVKSEIGSNVVSILWMMNSVKNIRQDRQ